MQRFSSAITLSITGGAEFGWVASAAAQPFIRWGTDLPISSSSRAHQVGPVQATIECKHLHASFYVFIGSTTQS
jgi:hypothetical protein